MANGTSMFTRTTRSLQRRQIDFPLSVLTQAGEKQLIDKLGFQSGKNSGQRVAQLYSRKSLHQHASMRSSPGWCSAEDRHSKPGIQIRQCHLHIAELGLNLEGGFAKVRELQ